MELYAPLSAARLSGYAPVMSEEADDSMSDIPEQRWALALHGGAGPVAGRDYSATEKHLGELAAACRARLEGGRSSLDVVEFAVSEMESSGLYVAGRGSAPNSAGYVELDASIMSGPTRRAGAVAALRDVVNPVAVARAVMETTPHVLLAGAGALAFARRSGCDLVEDPSSWYRLPIGVLREEIAGGRHGTVGAVALDVTGALAAATSTGGTFGKLEGRIGDTPLVGAGTWADDDVAISCTGVGERIIRAGGAVSIAMRCRSGVPLEVAVGELLDEIARLGGDAGVIAVTRRGEIVMRYNSDGMKRASVASDTDIVAATFA
jgi:isoaspartyl peptidase/L-asparaginase-like protein (Ntn-hydrolase superfamily)